jgi:hypothetical protein
MFNNQVSSACLILILGRSNSSSAQRRFRSQPHQRDWRTACRMYLSSDSSNGHVLTEVAVNRRTQQARRRLSQRRTAQAPRQTGPPRRRDDRPRRHATAARRRRLRRSWTLRWQTTSAQAKAVLSTVLSNNRRLMQWSTKYCEVNSGRVNSSRAATSDPECSRFRQTVLLRGEG